MEKPESIVVLNDEEVADVYARIYEMKDDWQRNHLVLPSFSLGISTHYNAYEEYGVYATHYRESNRRMLAVFGDVLEKVRAGVETVLDAPVVFDPEHLAVPGFHIFGAHRVYLTKEDSPHFDLHYLWHDWSRFDEVDATRTASVTLAIKVPQSGAGMRVWDVHYRDRKDSDDPGKLEWSQRSQYEHHAYTPGHAAVHSGHTMHAIAPAVAYHPDDERITLQGHTFFADGQHILYW